MESQESQESAESPESLESPELQESSESQESLAPKISFIILFRRCHLYFFALTCKFCNALRFKKSHFQQCILLRVVAIYR